MRRHAGGRGGALDKVAVPLGIDRAAAARGIVRIANNNMVNALKLVSLNRGHDPRDFTLVAFGGGGGMHAVALAAELGVRKVDRAAHAAVFSAWGMMMSDLRRDYFITRLADLRHGAATGIDAAIGETTAQARRAIRRRRRRSPADKLAIQGLRRNAATRTRSTPSKCCRGTAVTGGTRCDRGEIPETCTSANTPTASTRRSRLSACIWCRRRRGRQADMATERQSTGAPLQIALKRPPRRRLRARGHPRSRDLRRRPHAARHGVRAARRSSRIAAPPIVLHPGNAVEIDGYGNIHIELGLEGAA